MAKRQLKPAVGLRPVPIALVTCVGGEGRANIITLAWVGVVCSLPPMLSIAVRPERFSHDLIESTGQFVVNLPSVDQLWAADYCGTRSGRFEDKFAAAGLTPIPATEVKPPLIAECPINIECVVRHELRLGSHDLFIGEVVALHAEEDALDETGNLSAAGAGLITYDQPNYWSLGSRLAPHGHSKTRVLPHPGGVSTAKGGLADEHSAPDWWGSSRACRLPVWDLPRQRGRARIGRLALPRISSWL